MLKAAGLVMIVTAGCGLGLSESLALTRRQRALAALLRMAGYLKGEIRFGGTSLFDAFLGAAARMEEPYKSFLKAVGAGLQEGNGQTLDEIFRRCAGQKLGVLPLLGEEWESFLALGSRLGYLDRDMQLLQISRYEEEQSRRIRELSAELPGKKKMCRSLGILGGILLAVLVW